MYRLSLDTQSVSIKGFQKHYKDHIKVSLHLLHFLEDYRKSNSKSEEKLKCMDKRITEIICTQSVIFSSFPLNNKEMKKEFMDFDNQVKQISPTVYQLSGNKSKKLLLLRKTNFHFYQLIQHISIKLNK